MWGSHTISCTHVIFIAPILPSVRNLTGEHLGVLALPVAEFLALQHNTTCALRFLIVWARGVQSVVHASGPRGAGLRPHMTMDCTPTEIYPPTSPVLRCFFLSDIGYSVHTSSLAQHAYFNAQTRQIGPGKNDVALFTVVPQTTFQDLLARVR